MSEAMIKMGLYSEPINEVVKGYAGLYRESFIVDFAKNNDRLERLVNSFFEISVNGQDLEYNEDNKKMIS